MDNDNLAVTVVAKVHRVIDGADDWPLERTDEFAAATEAEARQKAMDWYIAEFGEDEYHLSLS